MRSKARFARLSSRILLSPRCGTFSSSSRSTERAASASARIGRDSRRPTTMAMIAVSSISTPPAIRMPRTIQRAHAEFAASQVIADGQHSRSVVVDLAVEPAMAAVADPVPMARDGAAAAAQPGDLVGLGRPHGGQHRIVDLVQLRQPPAGALLGAALVLAEPGMGQHLVAAGQDERLAPARELEALDEARQVRGADGRTDDAAELPAHADRHDDRQDRLADDERPLRLGPLRPVQSAGAGRVNSSSVKRRFSRRSGRMLRSSRVKRIGSPSIGMTTKPTACGAAASAPSAKLFHCSRSSKSMSPLATASLI